MIIYINHIIKFLFVFMIFYLTKEPKSEDQNKLNIMVQKRKDLRVFLKKNLFLKL